MRILIIGLGSIAKTHISVLKSLYPNCVILAYRSSINTFNNIEGVLNIYSFEEVKDQLDFIIISNPSSLHGMSILDSLLFKVPIFIEKPVLSSLLHSENILNIINKNNTITYVACNLRFNPALIFLKNLISNNLINTINEVNIYCGSYLPDWRPNVDFKDSYSSHSNLGGGVDLDLIHEIDYAIWLFGLPNSYSSFKSSSSTLEIESFDYANYNLIYNNFTVNIKLNYYRRDKKREIEILTQNDTLLVDLNNSKISSLVSKSEIFSTDYNIYDTYLDQMKYFVESIESNMQPMNSFEEGLETLKIALNNEVKR